MVFISSFFLEFIGIFFQRLAGPRLAFLGRELGQHYLAIVGYLQAGFPADEIAAISPSVVPHLLLPDLVRPNFGHQAAFEEYPAPELEPIRHPFLHRSPSIG